MPWIGTKTDTMVNQDLPRRNFFKHAIVVLNSLIALALAVPGLGFLLSPIFKNEEEIWIELGPQSRFRSEAPQKATFKYESTAGYTRKVRNSFVWILPDSSEALVALSAVCSHTGCNVAWNEGEQLFVCPCHDGRYATNGEVVSGPPPRPLQELQVKLENGTVFVKLLV